MHRLTKTEILKELEFQYNEWESEEKESILNGSGRKGSNGELTKYSLSELFNEIMWRIM